jgi:hypothetical protein
MNVSSFSPRLALTLIDMTGEASVSNLLMIGGVVPSGSWVRTEFTLSRTS